MNQLESNHSIRAIIVDDEFRSRASLRLLLSHHFQQVEIAGEAETVAEGIVQIKSQLPDLVFLDIMLPDGSAFDLLDVLAQPQLKVIIISAFPEHSIRAFKYAALHYLLKPIDLRDLKDAMMRVIGVPATTPVSIPKPGVNDLVLPTLEGFKVVPIAEIVVCEANANYTTFHFRDGSTFTASYNLGHYEGLLSGEDFLRVHNKFLIHLMHVKAYHKGRGGSVEMSNGKIVEVSARKRESFLMRLAHRTKGM